MVARSLAFVVQFLYIHLLSVATVSFSFAWIDSASNNQYFAHDEAVSKGGYSYARYAAH